MKNIREILYNLRSRFNTLYDTVMGKYATGTLTVVGQVIQDETTEVNGVEFTFVDLTVPSEGHPSEFEFEFTATDTLTDVATKMASQLNGSDEAELVSASYSSLGPVVSIVHKTVGEQVGLDYSLINSSSAHVTKSGGSLTGGVDSYEQRISALE